MHSGWRTMAPAKARLTLRWVLLCWTEGFWEKLFEIGSAKHHLLSPRDQIYDYFQIARAAPVGARDPVLETSDLPSPSEIGM
jgi:hypothetical protein